MTTVDDGMVRTSAGLPRGYCIMVWVLFEPSFLYKMPLSRWNTVLFASNSNVVRFGDFPTNPPVIFAMSGPNVTEIRSEVYQNGVALIVVTPEPRTTLVTVLLSTLPP